MKTVIATAQFQSQISKIWDEDEFLDFASWIAVNPEAGKLIKGKGLRKLRWAASGRGKRGGARIIYYHVKNDGEVILLTIYAKNVKSDLTEVEMKQLVKYVEEK